MTTKHPRINLVIEKPVYNVIKTLSRENDLSLSSQVRDLVIKALEEIEDRILVRIADQRQKTFNPKTALTYDALLRKTREKK